MPDVGITGEEIHDGEGNRVRFRVSVVNGYIDQAQYGCTTCVTLVGLCEHLSELIRNRSIFEARMLSPLDLLALHQEVPPERHNRAVLAVNAMHSAIQRILKGGAG